MVSRLCAELSRRLSEVTDDADFEARVLVETVFGRDVKLKELSGSLKEPSKTELERLEELISRRLSGKPLQYLVGEWEFYGLELKVSESVLIPRQDTESLVDTALGLIKDISAPKALDLCSGTGCIALAIKSRRPDAEVTALELYSGAYEVLSENCRRYGGGVMPVCADALDERTVKNFSGLDLITANPPYLTACDMAHLQKEVEFEPKEALFGGEDGLDFYRRLSKIWRESLRDGGYIVYEIGAGQKEAVTRILEEAGWHGVSVKSDLTGKPRVATAWK